MLELCRLELRNFGPFRGDQSIEFPSQGVVIIYGENGRGKTTLLNALRYALLGKVVGYGGAAIREDRMINWEAIADDDPEFRVKLDLRYEGRAYQIVRKYQRPSRTNANRGNDNVSERFYVTRDGDVLPYEAGILECRRIMPEEVSRFFLFDGELLQEYQELLRDDSQTGRMIAEAIEQILGVPVLTGARRHLDILFHDAAKREAAEARKDRSLRQVANELDEWLQRVEALRKEVDRQTEKLRELASERDHILERLDEFQYTQRLIYELRHLKEEISDLDARLEESQANLRQWMSEAWSVLLRPQLDALIKRARQQINVEREKMGFALGQQRVRDMIRKALLQDSCPICTRVLDEDTRRRLEESLNDEDVSVQDTMAIEERLKELARRVDILERARSSRSIEVAKQLRHAIDETRVKIATKEGRVRELESELAGCDVEGITRETQRYETVVKEHALVEQALREAKRALAEANARVEELQRKMNRLGHAQLSRERSVRELCERLRAVFDASVAHYRELLRDQIERDATSLFRSLVSEPDYERLAITPNYGLRVIHRDGREIPVRSAGQEHIIALSLIGALQRNAPLQGPIVMDTPFGRLDRRHGERVLRTLPQMARQVILLVHDNEIDPNQAREVLRGSLKAEYRLVRRSARHTVLEPALLEG